MISTSQCVQLQIEIVSKNREEDGKKTLTEVIGKYFFYGEGFSQSGYEKELFLAIDSSHEFLVLSLYFIVTS